MTKEPRPHPDHEWLLQMTDGELEPEVRAAMQKHLEACWECRHELQQIEGAISDAVRYRKEVLVRHMPDPPQEWRDLSSGFEQIDRELGAPGFWSRMGSALRMPRYAIPLAAAALGAMAIVVSNRVDLEPASTSVPSVSVSRQPSAAVTLTPEQGARGTPLPLGVPAVEEVGAVPPPAAALAHSVVLVVQLLHERGADLGDPLEISRAHDRVIVRGIGLDSARARELEPLLKDIPFVEFRQSAAGAASAATTVARFAAAADAPFQKQLEAAMGGEAAVDALTSDCLDHADLMMTRAHALRRLDEQFAGEALTAEDQRTLQSLRSAHAKALAAELARLERSLVPALRGLSATAGPVAAEATSDANLFSAARRLESSIAELLGAKTVTGASAELPQRVATDLARASALARSLTTVN